MNKNDYLKELKRHLKHMNKEEKEDILNEYDTHFYSGQQEGKSESEVCIVAVMGLSLLNFFIVTIPAFLSILLVLTFIIFTLASLVAPLMLLIKGIMDGFHSIILYDIFMTGLMFGVGLVLAVVTYYLIKWLFYLTMKYLKWNISIVKGSVQS
ncbi:DUF1700 domain-containing protein [Staphylococcus epidermidis]|nr:DUF1700 domain-containing protein [Staphylococcus epidermidis]